MTEYRDFRRVFQKAGHREPRRVLDGSKGGFMYRTAILAAAFTVKWDGRWQWEVGDGCFNHPGGGAAMVFTVTPARVFAHAKGDPFGATTHRF